MPKILFAADGSPDSLKAARFLPQLCAIEELKVTLIQIKDPSLLFQQTGGMITDDIMTRREHEARESLEHTAAVLKEKGIDSEQRTEWGDPAQTVTEMAQKEGFDLIVCGSRGLGGVAGLLLGSVSERIVHRAHCSVMVVR